MKLINYPYELRALEKWTILYLNINFRSWNIWIFSIAEYNEVFLDHQNCDSAGKTILSLVYRLIKNIITAYKIYFDTCKLTNVKLYLNSEFYPYDDLNLDFDKRRAAILYNVYLRFRTSY